MPATAHHAIDDHHRLPILRLHLWANSRAAMMRQMQFSRLHFVMHHECMAEGQSGYHKTGMLDCNPAVPIIVLDSVMNAIVCQHIRNIDPV